MNIIEQLIEKLKERTQNDTYKWVTLSEYLNKNSNESLRKYVVTKQKSYYATSYVADKGALFLDENNSYCVSVNSGVIAVLTYKYGSSKTFVLAAQKTSFSKVCELNVVQELQNEIASLILLLQEKVDNINDFIDEILK